jgi:uncharacterized membrane protein YheB (UPF0754 family)
MIEFAIGILVIFVALIVLGKLRGAPKPREMTIENLGSRLTFEMAWINRYNSQPEKSRNAASLLRMYQGKIAYIDELKSELSKRKPQESLEQTIQHELDLIHEADEVKNSSLPVDPSIARTALIARFDLDEPASTPGYKKQRNFFGEIVEIDVRTEDEKLDAMRNGIETRFRKDAKLSQEKLDVDIFTNEVLSKIVEDKSMGSAFYEMCVPLKLPHSLRNDLLKEIEDVIRNGTDREEAIQSTLARFKASDF